MGVVWPCTCSSGAKCAQHDAYQQLLKIPAPTSVPSTPLIPGLITPSPPATKPWRCPGCKRWNAPTTPFCCKEDGVG